MNMKRIFSLALTTLLLCLPMLAMAESVKCINDIPHYYSTDGTVSVDISDNQITWLQESSQGQIAWIGLDNSEQVFEDGSQFYVRWLSRQDTEWDTHFGNLDDKNKPIDWMCMLELGVVGSDGNIESIENKISLYVQLEDNWDTDNLQVCYIAPEKDETFNEYVALMQTPDGMMGRFVEFSTNHFSPYCVYNIGKYDSSELPKTGDNSNVILWSALACISMLGMVMIACKRKEA